MTYLKYLSTKPSKMAYYLLILVMLVSTLSIRKWEKSPIIEFDAVHYYSYLPAVFIQKDIELNFYEADPVGYWNRNEYRPSYTAEGKKIFKTTMGLAIFYAPFFFMAHGYVLTFGQYAANGFTLPYQIAIAFAALFYLFVGLYYLRKILVLFWDEWTAAITLLGVVLGTNLFYYSVLEPAYAHVFGFSILIVFVHLCIKWHKEQLPKYTIGIGLLLGLILLMRPTNGLIGLFFLIYGVGSWPQFKARYNTFLRHIFSLILMAALAFLVLLPQLLYWKHTTGNYIFNSYIGERFYFSNPQIINGLFSYRKGWLVYTPIMLLALVGIPLLWKNSKAFFLPVFLFVFISIYLAFSWWCWWYGGSFGQRCMVDFYGILAIPMAQSIHTFKNKSHALRPALIAFLLLLIPYNLFQTYQYTKAIIHWDSMTKEAYWAVFGSTERPLKYEKMLVTPDYEEAKKENKNK